MWTPARRRLFIVTAVLILQCRAKLKRLDYYNLSAISPDEISSELSRIKEAYPEHRKLGADGVAPGPLRNQSSSGADLNLLGSDRMEPVALLAQTNASQDRIHQLTAQQKQAPSAENERTRKEGDGLRLQLAQTTEKPEASQDRAPDAETDRARKENEGLRLQLAHTTEELKAYRDRVHQLEAQLKQAPGAVETSSPRTGRRAALAAGPHDRGAESLSGSGSPARGTAEAGAGRSRAGQGAQTGRRTALAAGAGDRAAAIRSGANWPARGAAEAGAARSRAGHRRANRATNCARSWRRRQSSCNPLRGELTSSRHS